ncbi:hypothetical protein SFUMM280S_07654 [Streptomyces fumanus]
MTAHPAERADPRFPDLADPRTFIDTDLPALAHPARRGAGALEPARRGPARLLGRHPLRGRTGGLQATGRFTSEQGNVLSTLLQGGDSAAGKMPSPTGPGTASTEADAEVVLPACPGARRPPGAPPHPAADRRGGGPGEADFATDVADHIPINTIGDLMDIPVADRGKPRGVGEPHPSRYDEQATRSWRSGWPATRSCCTSVNWRASGADRREGRGQRAGHRAGGRRAADRGRDRLRTAAASERGAFDGIAPWSTSAAAPARCSPPCCTSTPA